MKDTATDLKTLLKRPIFKEITWYSVAQIIIQALSFLGVIIVSRYLGPSQLGLYSFTQSYVLAFITIAGGMDFYFIWKIAKSNNYFSDVREYVAHKINIYILISIACVISAVVVLPRDVAFLVVIMITPVFIQSLNVFSLYAVATKRAKLISILQIITASSTFVLKVTLVFLGASLTWFIFVSAIDLVLTGVIIGLYFLRMPEWRAVFSGFRTPTFLKSIVFLYSIRSSIIAITSWQFLLRADLLVLATFSNAHALGIYSAAVKIAEVPGFLAGILSTALISRVAGLSMLNNAQSREGIKQVIMYYLGVGIIVTIMIILFASLAINILYGSQFVESILVLRVYALSIPGMFLTYFFISIYGAREMYHHQAIIFGASLCLNIILIYLLAPSYGLVGAAFATAIAYTVAPLCFYINLKNKI